MIHFVEVSGRQRFAAAFTKLGWISWTWPLGKAGKHNVCCC